jgi:hypothetical protein
MGGCAQQVGAPPNGFEHGAATRTCRGGDGPAKFPATAIILAREPISGLAAPPYPFVTVQVNELSLNQLAGRSWDVGNGEQATAYWVSSDTDHAIANRGRITVTIVSNNSVVEGDVDLTFPRGPVKGTFKAPWIEPTQICR